MISRRNFLKFSGLLSIFPPLATFAKNPQPVKAKQIIKPPALKPGDTIGLITPASPLFEFHRTVIEVTEKIQNLGYKVKLGKNIGKKLGYLAGTIQERVEDLHQMFKDDDVKAIMAIRGGYGSGQLLPYLDYKLIRSHPKILIGYSDITSLLLGIHAQTGLVTFHGPVAVSTFTDYTRNYLNRILGSKSAPIDIEDAPFEENLQTTNRIWTFRGGAAEGRLIGGNLTLFQATIGTPFEPDTKGAVLFFEEVSEEPYDLDRMLNHLKSAGKFDRCKAVIFDKLPSVEPADYKPAFRNTLSVEEIIEQVFKDYDFPVCVGFSLGHIKNKPTLPLGITARLNADSAHLQLTEAAVS
ncbi:MAG: LD-carboxypeptidase [Calditrichaeota bacterium]|nr:LD-carboxypeptidase [Calditrichota bacterium]